MKDLRKMKELVLTHNKSTTMPNVPHTLALYFSQIVTLDVSYNLIKNIEGRLLI